MSSEVANLTKRKHQHTPAQWSEREETAQRAYIDGCRGVGS